MFTEKTNRYTNKNMDLDRLSEQVANYMNSDGYAIQKAKSPSGTAILARKENLPRDLITADRAFTILISGQPNDFTVRVGIGRWGQNLTVTAVEALFTGGAMLIVDVPEMAWNEHIENKIIKNIAQIIEGKPMAQMTS